MRLSFEQMIHVLHSRIELWLHWTISNNVNWCQVKLISTHAFTRWKMIRHGKWRSVLFDHDHKLNLIFSSLYETTVLALNQMINDTRMTTDTSLIGCDFEPFTASSHDFDKSFDKVINCTGTGVVLFAFKQFVLPYASDTLTMKSADGNVIFGKFRLHQNNSLFFFCKSRYNWQSSR